MALRCTFFYTYHESETKPKSTQARPKNSIPLRFSFSQLHTLPQILILCNFKWNKKPRNEITISNSNSTFQDTFCNKPQQRNAKIFTSIFLHHSLISRETNKIKYPSKKRNRASKYYKTHLEFLIRMCSSTDLQSEFRSN